MRGSSAEANVEDATALSRHLRGALLQFDMGHTAAGQARPAGCELGETPLSAMVTLCPGGRAVPIKTQEDFEKARPRHLLASREWQGKRPFRNMIPLLPSRVLPRGVVYIGGLRASGTLSQEGVRIRAAMRAFHAGHAVVACAEGGATVAYLPVLFSSMD